MQQTPEAAASDSALAGGGIYYTIHITPELECCYVSFETNWAGRQQDITRLIQSVVSFFRPGHFTLTLFEDQGSYSLSLSLSVCPETYTIAADQGSPLALSGGGEGVLAAGFEGFTAACKSISQFEAGYKCAMANFTTGSGSPTSPAVPLGTIAAAEPASLVATAAGKGSL